MVNAWFSVLLWINLASYFRHANLIRQTHYPDERHYIFLISLTRSYKTYKTQNSCQDKVYLRSSIRANQRRLKRNEENPTGSQGGFFHAGILKLMYKFEVRIDLETAEGTPVHSCVRHTCSCVPGTVSRLERQEMQAQATQPTTSRPARSRSLAWPATRQSPGTRRSLSFMI